MKEHFRGGAVLVPKMAQGAFPFEQNPGCVELNHMEVNLWPLARLRMVRSRVKFTPLPFH